MSVRDRMNKVFREIFEDPTISLKDETTAQDVEGWDSLRHIDLIMQLEEEFGLRFTVDDITGLKNVGEMIAMLERKLSAK
ncbi:MAG: acyl carrier protein [Xanthobacteraceae bacterium]|nr:acyl carrier protein [Xanthobacteraceae bacterium]MBX3548090.1 acyl carrier protein [Xanthobacteraceae bacterium]